MLHSPGHSSEECKALQFQAKRMKATYEAQTPKGKKKWKKNEELNAIIGAVVNQMCKNKKKRKISKDEKIEEANVNEMTEFSSLSLSSNSSDD